MTALAVTEDDPAVDAAVDAVIGMRRRVSDRPHKPAWDGALEVRPLARPRADTWEPCEFPGCVGLRGGNNLTSGRRPSAAALFVMGRSLGAYCDKHVRELRGVWGAQREPVA